METLKQLQTPMIMNLMEIEFNHRGRLQDCMKTLMNRVGKGTDLDVWPIFFLCYQTKKDTGTVILVQILLIQGTRKNGNN